ncbi:BtpA/SgcQ family protein [Nannocystis sp. RBIL2]|uniref:BtpA/SgcQ family protein n=1 Tax=Nannocystis sp. RBIL2 TaxID=2996788 RepID=UPI00227155B9|nr:BtpA/SgcQ family protein [Nannocystis sp. RBIL2]MCY1063284.1 BtpA/SgcQ family protein [Nannocystis sp. RBIL2]
MRSLVGVLHLPPLPGSPRSSEPVAAIARAVARDARALAAAGFDLAVVENFGDVPFFKGHVPSVTIAGITACALAVRDACPDLALGINVLRNDGLAAVAIAVVVGAASVRINVLSGARVTDQGVVEGQAADVLRLRRELGRPDLQIWADVAVKHSAPLAARDLADETRDLVQRSLADAVLVTGSGTGEAVDPDHLRRVRAAAGGVPLYVASGATEAALPVLAGLCDGVIVGSALRADGRAGGPVDPERARRFADAWRAASAGA